MHSFTTVNAQITRRIDSLNLVLRAPLPDTSRLHILLQISDLYLQNNHHQALQSGEPTLQLAHQTGNQVWIAKTLLNVAEGYQTISHYKEAMKYTNQSLRISQKNKYQQNIGNAYHSLSHLYLEQSKLDSSLLFNQRALAISQSLSDQADICKSLIQQGGIFTYQGKYDHSAKVQLKALQLTEQLNTPLLMATVYVNIGMLNGIGNFAPAEKYLLQALKISDLHGFKKKSSHSLNNLSNLYTAPKKYTDALKVYRRAMIIEEELKDEYGLYGELVNLRLIYSKLKQYQHAKSYFVRCIGVAKFIGYPIAEGWELYNLDSLYLKMGQYDQALFYTEQSIDLAKKLGAKMDICTGYESLYEGYEKMGNYPKAFQTQLLFKQLIDSTFNETNFTKLNELEIKYETEKKENQIKVFSQQVQIQQLQFNQQRSLMIGLGVLILLLLAGYLFYRQYHLRTLQRTVDLEQQLLRTQMNPHFIFNALTAIQHFMYDNDSMAAGKYLAKFAKLTRMILENSREPYISLEKEIATLRYYLDLQSLRFQNKFDYSIEVDPNLDPASTMVPPMFAQPLIENSLEHGLLHKHEKGKIQVRFLSQGNTVLLEVEDNGVGRQKAAQLKQLAGKKYQSFATRITQERLSIINRKKSQQVKWSIIDLVDAQNTIQGTKATFLIPFRTEQGISLSPLERA